MTQTIGNAHVLTQHNRADGIVALDALFSTGARAVEVTRWTRHRALVALDIEPAIPQFAQAITNMWLVGRANASMRPRRPAITCVQV